MDRAPQQPGNPERSVAVDPLIATNVAVVGAGAAGLAAASALAAAGREVVLIAPPATPTDWRTSALLSGSVAFFEKLGAWNRLKLHASPLKRMRIVDATHRLIRAPEVVFSADEVGLDAFGYNIRNSDLTAGLEHRVAELGIRRLAALAESAQLHPDHITVTLPDGRAVHAKLVAAADGRRSAMREAAGIKVVDWQYAQAALVVNFSHTQSHEDTSTEFHTEHGPFTLVPLGVKQSSLVWVGRPDSHQRRMALSAEALAAEIEERSQSILGAVTLTSPRQLFPLSAMTARRFAANRVALIGEAGHVVPPIGAQGLNLGLRDVSALVETVADASDPGRSDLLDRYDRARQFDVVSRTGAIDLLNRTVLSDLLPVQAARGLGLFLLDRIPALKHAAMRQGLGAR
jgi:2-octaprenyl-6-methoxyphenol hydroxylase